jgi:serine phosphatase RsbU (regulator of sigma subunit)
MEVGADLRVSFPPLGMQPSLHAIDRSALGESALGFKNRYETNEWWLMGAGDILLLHTDGLLEHARGDEPYFPNRLEDVMRAVKHLSAREILDGIYEDLLAFNKPSDDISVVVIKLG